MNGVLLDTKIILDIALERREFFEKSKELLSLVNKSGFSAYVTATTVTDIYYVLKKSKMQVFTPSAFIKQYEK